MNNREDWVAWIEKNRVDSMKAPSGKFRVCGCDDFATLPETHPGSPRGVCGAERPTDDVGVAYKRHPFLLKMASEGGAKFAAEKRELIRRGPAVADEKRKTRISPVWFFVRHAWH